MAGEWWPPSVSFQGSGSKRFPGAKGTILGKGLLRLLGNILEVTACMQVLGEKILSSEVLESGPASERDKITEPDLGGLY